MKTLTIEVPAEKIDEVIKYLKEKQVTIRSAKSLEELTIDDYRKDTFIRAKNRRGSASNYLWTYNTLKCAFCKRDSR